MSDSKLNIDQLESVAGGIEYSPSTPDELIEMITKDIESMKRQGLSREEVVEATTHIKSDKYLKEIPGFSYHELFFQWVRITYDKIQID